MRRDLLFIGLIASVVCLHSCKGDDGEEITDPVVNTPDVQILSPTNEQQFNAGDVVSVSIKVNSNDVSDINLYVDDTLFAANLDANDKTLKIDTKNGKVGQIRIHLKYKNAKGEDKGDSRSIVIFSDIQPEYKSAVIVNEYPHNPGSYTQGLEFYKGFLFEGTGQRGSSILAEVDLTTGDIKRMKQMDNAYFGEGITILNDTIYQLTYTSSVCKVYDLKFNEINEFTYTGQGWGLCNNGSQLIMSNGSSEIVWRDPKTFAITKRLQVFEPTKEVVNINELELIEGRLYANMYTEKNIVEIDTATGKVLSYIDCNALVTDATGPETDVLNGIAYNPVTQKIYMTGKLWPKLYEVKFE